MVVHGKIGAKRVKVAWKMANYITRTCGLVGSDVITKQGRMVKQAQKLGILPMSLYYYPVDSDDDGQLNSRLDGVLSGFSFGDNLILQLPTMLGDRYEHALMDKINVFRQSSTSKLVIAIHDVTTDRERTQQLINDYYNQADALIVPSVHYGHYLQELGLDRPTLIYLRVYDQVSDFRATTVPPFNSTIQLLDSNRIVEESTRQLGLLVSIHGEAQLADSEKQLAIHQQGGWGVIWPQDAAEEWQQRMSPALEFLQLMLAGVPVVVKDGSALARLVRNHHLGIVADKLEDGLTRVQQASATDYQKMGQAVQTISRGLASGELTAQALNSAVMAVQLMECEER